MVSRAIALFGTDQTDPPMRRLSAGPLSVAFDNGALRYVQFNGAEVLRGIAFLVRDENWGTMAAKLENLVVEETPRHFSVSYRATCADASRTLVYDANIQGNSDGSLSFDVVAEAKTDVLTNRTGFIVLHPVDGVSGRPVRVLHVDGREESSTFPETIDPRCPFKDIRALSHEVAPGTWATCTMEGDAFEMEDQRNWSDASYKTYVRPLTRPWPYTLPKGDKSRQAVSLSIVSTGNAAAARGASDDSVAVTIGDAIGSMPRFGVGVPSAEALHALERPELTKRLGVQSLICEIDLRKGHGRAELERCRALAELTGAEVTLEIITLGSLDPSAELASVAAAVAETGLKPAAVTAFPMQELVSYQPDQPWPPMPSFAETYGAARRAFPGVPIGGGMAAYFTELNRKRPPAEPIDFVSHTTCPNVHAADDRSVMETNEAIPYQILSTRAFMGDRIGYRIGPSQLGCRENPYGKTTTPNPGNARVCLSAIDPRQRGLLNAAWMLAYATACAQGGVDAVAFGALTGPMGHIHRAADFSQPYFDDLGQPAVYPSFHVLCGLAGLAGAPLLSTQLSHTGKIAALAALNDGSTCLWLANLTADAVIANVPAADKRGARMTRLDADSFERLTTTPDYLDCAAENLLNGSVSLDAYAVARIVIP